MDRNRKRLQYHEGEVGSPATNSDTNYREEAITSMASTTANDEAIPNLTRRIASDTAGLKTKGRAISIATRNVRTLY